jgi:hypothetical protein
MPLRRLEFMTPQKVINKTAAYFRKDPRHWIQNRGSNGDGGFCMLGGISHFADANKGPASYKLYCEARGLLNKVIDKRTNSLCWGISTYNDEEGRTLDEILSVMDEAASL